MRRIALMLIFVTVLSLAILFTGCASDASGTAISETEEQVSAEDDGGSDYWRNVLIRNVWIPVAFIGLGVAYGVYRSRGRKRIQAEADKNESDDKRL